MFVPLCVSHQDETIFHINQPVYSLFIFIQTHTCCLDSLKSFFIGMLFIFKPIQSFSSLLFTLPWLNTQWKLLYKPAEMIFIICLQGLKWIRHKKSSCTLFPFQFQFAASWFTTENRPFLWNENTSIINLIGFTSDYDIDLPVGLWILLIIEREKKYCILVVLILWMEHFIAGLLKEKMKPIRDTSLQ